MWKDSTLWHAIPARISETAAVAGASPCPAFFNILPAKFQFIYHQIKEKAAAANLRSDSLFYITA